MSDPAGSFTRYDRGTARSRSVISSGSARRPSDVVVVSPLMRVRFASLLLSSLLVVTALLPLSAALRPSHELAATRAGSERLFLPSCTPLSRVVAVAGRGEKTPTIERRFRDPAEARADADRVRRFDPERPASHDKRPLPRSLDEPPQPDEQPSRLA
jgi:hypothetical protein